MEKFYPVYNRNKRKLYNYVLQMVGSREISEDILQNVFMKLYENIGSIDKINNIDAWLFIAARNEIYTMYRKRSVRREHNKETDMTEVEYDGKVDLLNELELKDFKEHLTKQLGNISEEHREIFLLKEYGGFSYKEISEMLNIDVALVKSRLYKVRQKLIKQLRKIVN